MNHLVLDRLFVLVIVQNTISFASLNRNIKYDYCLQDCSRHSDELRKPSLRSLQKIMSRDGIYLYVLDPLPYINVFLDDTRI